MKNQALSLAAALVALLAFNAPAARAQTMTLRDAIYLYTYPIKSTGAAKKLVGQNCDIFELALKVQSGYTDLILSEGGVSSNYPDRINSGVTMFAYTLYSNQADKRFTLVGQSNGSVQQVGAATVFGYCFSTRQDARVLMYDEADKTCRYSNGSVVANCQID
jgi:hypothetical protein